MSRFEHSPYASRNTPSLSQEEQPTLVQTEQGLALMRGNLALHLDFRDLLERCKPGKLSQELVVRAAKGKRSRARSNAATDTTSISVCSTIAREHPSTNGDASQSHAPLLIDATAGLGHDAFLLAAAGFSVVMFEQDPLIAALLQDALERARALHETAPIAKHMELKQQDSIPYLQSLEAQPRTSGSEIPDVVYLDPMFPARSKRAAVKKKFQLLHQLEQPCSNEEELLDAALGSGAHKIVVKRTAKGPHLAGHKPAYSLMGKMVRFDCYINP